MKKTIICGMFLFFGLLADTGILLVGAIYGATLTEWHTEAGKVWTGISHCHLVPPFVIATALIVVAAIALIREYFVD